MIRVVVDPGVFVSGAVTGSDSPTAVVLDLAEHQQIELLVCPALIAELGDVLLRPKFRRWFTEEAAHDLLSRLTRLATMHPDPTDGVVRTRDPKDDYLLALAMETKRTPTRSTTTTTNPPTTPPHQAADPAATRRRHGMRTATGSSASSWGGPTSWRGAAPAFEGAECRPAGSGGLPAVMTAPSV